MDTGTLIFILCVWNLVGLFALLLIWSTSTGWMEICEGWEIVNPYYVYKYCKSVNWFGAIIIALLFTVICPIGAVFYWFYKLCTVGRK